MDYFIRIENPVVLRGENTKNGIGLEETRFNSDDMVELAWEMDAVSNANQMDLLEMMYNSD